MKNLKLFIDTFFEFLNSIWELLFPTTTIEKKLQKITGEELFKTAQKINSYKKQKNNYCVFKYDDPLIRGAIWSLKYRRNKKIARLFAESISSVFIEVLEDATLFQNFIQPILITIPANKHKKRERGFNQTDLIAKALIKNLPKNLITYKKNILKRKGGVVNQARSVGRKERFKNLKNSFQASQKMYDKNIIIIDDVQTSGATLQEAKRALKTVRAKKIICFTIAC